MQTNKKLHTAKKNKYDEFYTSIKDIENELQNYIPYLQNKIIYCNCDTPDSNFVKYFVDNFEQFKIKQLIATSYNPNGKGIYFSYNGIKTKIEYLIGNGDFRSAECTEILKQSDIVITNPPFSLFREYVKQLYDNNKYYIIIGNKNALGYKEIFPLFKDKRMYIGCTIPKHFVSPDTDKNIMGICNWFTNILIDKDKPLYILRKKYNETDYPKYDNYNGINVDKTIDIPYNYNGVLGVPISFIDKYNYQFVDVNNNPIEFEIVRFRKGDNNKDLSVSGKEKYYRI